MRRGWLLAALLSACAAPRLQLGSQAADDPAALDAATTAFYEAQTPAQLQAAVEGAQRAGKNTGRYHELAARLAFLEGKVDEAFEHELLALADTGYDAGRLMLDAQPLDQLSFAQRARLTDLLRTLSQAHPDPVVREAAAWKVAVLTDEEGPWAERDSMIAGLPGRLTFSTVGPFDNDQGRAWDTELEPEKHSQLGASYHGRSGPLGWRSNPPKDPMGELDFAAILTPSAWQVAYAQAQLDVPRAGAWRLVLSSTDNVKVWVDQKLIFSSFVSGNNDQSFFDVPLQLTAGTHRLLIKSANGSGDRWVLGARLVPVAEPLKVPDPPLDGERLALWETRALEPAARKRVLLAQWTYLTFGGNDAVQAAERALAPVPGALIARLDHFTALWFNGEAGRAGDVISELSRAHGKALPWLKLRLAHYQGHQNFVQQQRDLLREVILDAPGLALAHESLASAYEQLTWFEEAWKVREGIAARFPATPGRLEGRADLLDKLNRRTEAAAIYEQLRVRFPGRSNSLNALTRFAKEAGDLRHASVLRRERLANWPTVTSAWLELADFARRRGDTKELEAALAEVERLQPLAAEPSVMRGLVAAEAGRVEDAVRHWRHAIALNPDQPQIASRIDEADPSSRGEWVRDVPGIDELLAVAKSPLAAPPPPNARKAYLRDEEVVLLGSDGSASRVVTVVVRALDTAAVDDMLVWKLRRGGTLRLLSAFSVDKSGTLTQASERNREVRFRALQPGSTVVVQYRFDSSPDGYLGAYLTDQFAFQGSKSLQVAGRYVLWVARGSVVHQDIVGPVAFKRETRGGLDRLEWSVQNLVPIKVEPSMPPPAEVAAAVRVSTVPDWKTFLGWWKGILEGAFRESPELRALSVSLASGTTGTSDKLEKIQEWVQEQVRYQMDYESFIAGVKPHPAPMVLERRYGDCKDKAVLFVQLARMLGLEARVALVRTRDQGAVFGALPMQQFNHVIVYVPAQAGLDRPRFYDPTGTSLDLGTLPAMDLGTRVLIFEPRTSEFEWQTVPQLAPEQTRFETLVDAALQENGQIAGTVRFSGHGGFGAWLRKAAEDRTSLQDSVTGMTVAMLPGAEVAPVELLEVKSIRQPARVQAGFTAKDVLRGEGETLRLRTPLPAPFYAEVFAPTARAWPIRPTVSQVLAVARVKLPDGFELARVPPAVASELPCLKAHSQIKVEAGTVVASSSFELRCEEIPAVEFERYRALYFEHQRATREDLVLTRTRSKRK